MGIILEIRDGPVAGKTIGLKTGESVTIGRAAGRAQFALPHDTFMSGVHFAVECGPSGCRVQDRKSSNGTFLNGARIQDAMLANGDEIKGGQTIFSVKIVADAKLASLTAPHDVAATPAATPPALPPAGPRAEIPAARSVSPQAAPPADIPAAPPASPRGAPPVGAPLEERKPAAFKEVTPQPPRAPLAEPEHPAPVMRTADQSREVLDSALSPAAASKPQVKSLPPAPPARSVMPSQPAAGSFPPVRELPDKDAPVSGDEPVASSVPPPEVRSAPPVEEPPHLRAIPKPPSAAAKPPRASEPPPGVAPYIAQKFAENPAARSAAFSVMGWSFPAAPAEWQVQEGFGLQQAGHEEFPSSVAATEELLGGITLQQFVESQISTLRGYLRDPKIEPTMPPRVGGADESMAVDVRHSTKDGRELVYRRIYARSGSSVGVLTVTTLAAELPQVLQSLQPLLDGAAFHSSMNN